MKNEKKVMNKKQKVLGEHLATVSISPLVLNIFSKIGRKEKLASHTCTTCLSKINIHRYLKVGMVFLWVVQLHKYLMEILVLQAKGKDLLQRKMFSETDEKSWVRHSWIHCIYKDKHWLLNYLWNSDWLILLSGWIVQINGSVQKPLNKQDLAGFSLIPCRTICESNVFYKFF